MEFLWCRTLIFIYAFFPKSRVLPRYRDRCYNKPYSLLRSIPAGYLLHDGDLFFSRSPSNSEFGDIITLIKRKLRLKISQTSTELQTVYDLGWLNSLFIVDDNFIGNQRNAKRLQEVLPWMKEHDYPFTSMTETAVNLVDELPQLI